MKLVTGEVRPLRLMHPNDFDVFVDCLEHLICYVLSYEVPGAPNQKSTVRSDNKFSKYAVGGCEGPDQVRLEFERHVQIDVSYEVVHGTVFEHGNQQSIREYPEKREVVRGIVVVAPFQAR